MKNSARNAELTNLIRQLHRGNYRERRAVLKQVAAFNHKRATKAIAKLLNDQDISMVMLVVEVVGFANYYAFRYNDPSWGETNYIGLGLEGRA